mgnify:CR=1 FL=1
MQAFLNELQAFMDQGGFVMLPLAVAVLVLWYALGYRFATIKRGDPRSVRRLIRRFYQQQNNPGHDPVSSKGIVDSAIVEGLMLAQTFSHAPAKNLRAYLNDAFSHYSRDMSKYSRLIMTIVAAAPLTGLLGTVAGMIETFDSLMDANLFSQSGGGIAGGISQALFTTQMGLVVAIPGLIMGRALDRRQHRIERELEQIKDMLCSNEHKTVEVMT